MNFTNCFNLKKMKNTYFYFLAVFATILFMSCNNSKSSKFMGLRGKVETVKEFYYEAIEKFGEVEQGDLVQVHSYTFNTNGQLVKQSLYNEAGECIIRIENTYNGKERTQSTTYYSYSNETTIQNLIDVKDDTQIWEIKQGEEITMSECVKSDNYSCITKKKDGAVTEKQEHWFNDNGNVIEVKITNGKEIVYWAKSKFQDGNEVQTEFLKGELRGIATYLYSNYDNKENWTKKIVYRNGKPEGIVIRKIEYKQ